MHISGAEHNWNPRSGRSWQLAAGNLICCRVWNRNLPWPSCVDNSSLMRSLAMSISLPISVLCKYYLRDGTKVWSGNLVFAICTRSRELCFHIEIEFQSVSSRSILSIFFHVFHLSHCARNSFISMFSVTRIGIDAKVLSIDFRTDCSRRGFLAWNDCSISLGRFLDGPGSGDGSTIAVFIANIFSNASNKFLDSSILKPNFKHLLIFPIIFHVQTLLCSHAWPVYMQWVEARCTVHTARSSQRAHAQ